TTGAAVPTTASLPRRMVSRSSSLSYSNRVMSEFSRASMIALIFSTSKRTSSLHPGQILAGAGVDLDGIALVDEEGDLHDEAGLELGGLERAGDGIAPHPGIAFHDLEFHGVRQRDADRLASVEED